MVLILSLLKKGRFSQFVFFDKLSCLNLTAGAHGLRVQFTL